LAHITRTLSHGPPGGTETTEDTMDTVGTVLLLLLTGLNAVVWWRIWQRRRRRPRWHWVAWVRGRLWWHRAGLPSAVGAWVWQRPRWAPQRPFRVSGDASHAPPCVLCGDARHSAQEHIRLPQRALGRRAGGQDQPGKGP
jgi:hypothetical protein